MKKTAAVFALFAALGLTGCPPPKPLPPPIPVVEKPKPKPKSLTPQEESERKMRSYKLYREGLDAFLSGKKDAAQAKWSEALRIYPGNKEARRGLDRLKSKEKEEL